MGRKRTITDEEWRYYEWNDGADRVKIYDPVSVEVSDDGKQHIVTDNKGQVYTVPAAGLPGVIFSNWKPTF